MNNNPIIKKMKKQIPKHPTLKKYLKQMVNDGLTEDEALNIMINTWLIQRGLIK